MLFAEGGAVCGGVYRSNRTKVLNLVREMLCHWGSYRTATNFMEKFLLKDVYENVSAKDTVRNTLLTEFYKHVDLVHGYTSELVAEFAKERDGEALAATNSELKHFFEQLNQDTPPGMLQVSTMSTLSEWIESMSISGEVAMC